MGRGVGWLLPGETHVDFAASERTQALVERLSAFMREEVVPAERSTPRN
jgi:hypothetical protein